jgi:hypothetical protein
MRYRGATRSWWPIVAVIAVVVVLAAVWVLYFAR